METRICKKCNIEFPLNSEFFSIVTNKKPDGTKHRLFRGSCKKCMVKSVRGWQIDNPEKFHANEEKRRELLKNAEGYYTKDDIENIKKHQKNRCYYCGCELNEKQQIDHKLPLSKGGTNYASNLVLSCHTCNLDKHGKTDIEFFIWRNENGLIINEQFYK